MVGTRAAVLAGAGLLCVTGLAAAQPAAASDKDSYVQPTLLADTTAITPGTTFTVGILYKVQPDWHIYYKYPGASGFATTIKWQLPEGSSVGETLYPAPIAFEAPGPVISFGYEGETLLMAEVSVPKTTAEGKVELTAKSRWLMCSDRCIPNSKDLTLSLPVGKGEPANAEVFAKYRKALPKAVGEFPDVAKLQATPEGSSTNFALTITPPAGKKLVAKSHGDAHAAYFYPADAKGFVIEPPVVDGKIVDDGALKVYDGPVTIKWKSEPTVNTAEPLKHLDGTLVFQSATGGKVDEPVILSVSQKL